MQIFYILIWKERTAGLGNIFPGQFMIVAIIEKGARIPRRKENMATASGNATSTVLTEKDGNERRFPLFCAKSPSHLLIHSQKQLKCDTVLKVGRPESFLCPLLRLLNILKYPDTCHWGYIWILLLISWSRPDFQFKRKLTLEDARSPIHPQTEKYRTN